MKTLGLKRGEWGSKPTIDLESMESSIFKLFIHIKKYNDSKKAGEGAIGPKTGMENKNYRTIFKIAHVSFVDIGKIIRKYNGEET